MYINMYGCDRYGYQSLPSPEDVFLTGAKLENAEVDNLLRFDCTAPRALGWAAATYFVTLIVFGGIVLPTVLIGLVSVVFEKTTGRVQAETLVEIQLDSVLDRLELWYPDLDLQVAVDQLREVFHILDHSGEGTLDYYEARPFLHHIISHYISQDVTEAQTDLIVSAVLDANSDDRINFAEFVWLVALARYQYNQEDNTDDVDDVNTNRGNDDFDDADLEDESIIVVEIEVRRCGSRSIRNSGNDIVLEGPFREGRKVVDRRLGQIAALEEELGELVQEGRLEQARSQKRELEIERVRSNVRQLVFHEEDDLPTLLDARLQYIDQQEDLKALFASIGLAEFSGLSGGQSHHQPQRRASMVAASTRRPSIVGVLEQVRQRRPSVATATAADGNSRRRPSAVGGAHHHERRRSSYGGVPWPESHHANGLQTDRAPRPRRPSIRHAINET